MEVGLGTGEHPIDGYLKLDFKIKDRLKIDLPIKEGIDTDR